PGRRTWRPASGRWSYGSPPRRGDAVDEGQELGHGLVELLGELLTDLDGGVQRAGERGIRDHRYTVVGRELADLERDEVLALGHDLGRRRAAVVAQRDRVVRRVGDHDLRGPAPAHHP